MILYLIKAICCSALLLGVYVVLFRKEKILRFNRLYLTGSLVFSMTVPLIDIKTSKPIPVESAFAGIIDQPSEEWVLPQTDAIAIQPPLATHYNWLLIIYLAVSGMLLLRFLLNLWVLIYQARSSEHTRLHGIRLVLLNGLRTPYSFFNNVFLNKDDWQRRTVPDEILWHEVAHARQGHSWDILFIELLLTVWWFNPVLYLYRQAIKLNHEFMADEAVLKRSSDMASYQLLIIQSLAGQRQSVLSSSFNYHTTKRRFIMMTQFRNTKRSIIKELLLLPVLALAIAAFSGKIIAQSTPEKQDQLPRQQENRDTVVKPTIYRTWVGALAGGTKEGISDAELNEYARLTAKHLTAKDQWGQADINVDMPAADKQRLEELFLRMSKEQQLKQQLLFAAPIKPFAKSVPAAAQFNALKDPAVYGIWINNKRVPNSVLNNYTASDFSHLLVSKLYGRAKKGKTYTHQANLMTNAFYQDYYNNTMEHQQNRMVYGRMLPEKNLVRSPGE